MEIHENHFQISWKFSFRVNETCFKIPKKKAFFFLYIYHLHTKLYQKTTKRGKDEHFKVGRGHPKYCNSELKN